MGRLYAIKTKKAVLRPPFVFPFNYNGLLGFNFLVFEGGEGVGKTTQWHRLADTLRAVGHDVVAVREPGGTAAGDAIRSLLLDPTSELAAESEASNVESEEEHRHGFDKPFFGFYIL